MGTGEERVQRILTFTCEESSTKVKTRTSSKETSVRKRKLPSWYSGKDRGDFGKGINVGQMLQRTFLRPPRGGELHMLVEELT